MGTFRRRPVPLALWVRAGKLNVKTDTYQINTALATSSDLKPKIEMQIQSTHTLKQTHTSTHTCRPHKSIFQIYGAPEPR